MASATPSPASNSLPINVQSFLGGDDSTPKPDDTDADKSKEKTPDDANAVALQQFFALSVASGIQNLGVLLQILHVANYDVEKAGRIVELVRGNPPTEPASIATSQQSPATGDMHGRGHCSPCGPESAVQAFGNGLVASAAAASPYSAAVVSCAPGSAGVGVGTSSGTTTSTAVPLSAVTSLPANCSIHLDFSQPGVARGGTSEKHLGGRPCPTSLSIPGTSDSSKSSGWKTCPLNPFKFPLSPSPSADNVPDVG